MQLDDLKKTWEKELVMENEVTEFGDMRRRVDKFDQQIKFGVAMELLSCAGLGIFILLRLSVWPPAEEFSLLSQLSMLAMLGCLVFVAGRVMYSRKVFTIDDWTLSAKINIQIEKREKEAKMLNTAGSWYLAPVFVASVLVSYAGRAQRIGSYVPDLVLLVFWIVCFVLFVGAYFYFQHQNNTKVQPILEQLYVMKRELES